MTDNITPASSPEPTPTPAASPYTAATPAASPYVAPVTAASPTKRPPTVVAGVVIIAIQAVLSIGVALVLFATLAAAAEGADPDALAQAQLISGIVLAGGIINGIAIIFIARGYGIVRFVVVVVGGIVVALDLISGTPAFGDLLWLVAVILLFLPASNAWFKAKAAQRAGATV